MRASTEKGSIAWLGRLPLTAVQDGSRWSPLGWVRLPTPRAAFSHSSVTHIRLSGISPVECLCNNRVLQKSRHPSFGQELCPMLLC